MNDIKITKNPVLIIDAHNLFIRGYIASPKMNNVGESIGGLTNFLQTLSSLLDKFKPSHVYLVWEGGGGSTWRRSILSEYKNDRRPKRFNRIDDVEENWTDEVRQINRLVKGYLQNLPVKQIAVADCEADDIINEICEELPKAKPKILVSTDRDFYQLIGDSVKVYNPIKKVFINEESVKKEFGASCKNVVISRCFLGDKSDNIDGIKGIGLKFINDNFPFLKEDKEYSLIDIKNTINSLDKKSKAQQRILDEYDKLKRNWKLMNLKNAKLTYEQKNSMLKVLRDNENYYSVNRIFIMKECVKDGITIDAIGINMIEKFNFLSIRSKKEVLFLSPLDKGAEGAE